MVRRLFSIFGVFIVIFLIASLPLILKDGPKGLYFSKEGWNAFVSYFHGISNGTAFHYKLLDGMQKTHNFFKDASGYFLLSYVYLTVAAIISIIISTFLGVWQGKSKKGWFKDFLGLLVSIPDFILIMFVQLGVIEIYQLTGDRLVNVVAAPGQPAVFIPILTLSFIPAVYLIRTISEHTHDELSEDYVLTVRSKGLKPVYIMVQHIVRNVLPYLKADLHKVSAIMITNLLIVEYLSNLRGLTKLIFVRSHDYPYDLIVNGLFTFVVLYLALFWTIRLFVFGMERIFAYD